MSLYAPGISSKNASVSRNSIPTIAARSSSWVNRFRAADRENARPAPCGEELQRHRVARAPTPRSDAVPIDPGISPGSPCSPRSRPSATPRPSCSSASPAAVKLWWQLIRSCSTTGSPEPAPRAADVRSIISSRFSRAKCCAHRSSRDVGGELRRPLDQVGQVRIGELDPPLLHQGLGDLMCCPAILLPTPRLPECRNSQTASGLVEADLDEVVARCRASPAAAASSPAYVAGSNCACSARPSSSATRGSAVATILRL